MGNLLPVTATFSGFADPRCVAIAPDQSFALVTNYGTSVVSRIDLRRRGGGGVSNGAVTHAYSGFRNPWGVAISPDGRFALVGNSNGNNVGYIDLKTGQVSFPCVRRRDG